MDKFKSVMKKTWEILKKIWTVLKKIWNVVKKILGQLWLIIDSIKSFLIVILIALVIVFLGSMITHNVLRFEEISINYTGEYKKLYDSKDSMMNVYVTGGGNQTILIMSGFAVSSPTLEYKALADELGKEYRVVVVEYPGTGFSLSTKDERTNKNIVEEIREALKSAEITGPFILMPFDISNIYAMYYAENYSDEVLAIVSVNGMYPKAIKKDTFKNEYLPNYISNVNFHSVIGFSGLYRWETYLYPEKYNIDKLEKNSSYEDAEIKIYRTLLANKFYTKEMRNEIKTLEKNMKEMIEYKYPKNLPVVQILLNSTIEEYNSRGENLKKYATDIVSNSKIQKTRILNKNVEYYLFEDTKVLLNSLKNDLTFTYEIEDEYTEQVEDNIFGIIETEDEIIESEDISEDEIIDSEDTSEEEIKDSEDKVKKEDEDEDKDKVTIKVPENKVTNNTVVQNKVNNSKKNTVTIEVTQ